MGGVRCEGSGCTNDAMLTVVTGHRHSEQIRFCQDCLRTCLPIPGGWHCRTCGAQYDSVLVTWDAAYLDHA